MDILSEAIVMHELRESERERTAINSIFERGDRVPTKHSIKASIPRLKAIKDKNTKGFWNIAKTNRYENTTLPISRGAYYKTSEGPYCSRLACMGRKHAKDIPSQ
jgi:hypothetical protein